MALIKPIKQSDGVTTNYHRILYIQSATNSHISVAVLSYVDKSARELDVGEEPPYRRATVYETEYVENMSVSDAYDFLKTLPEFSDAVDG